jgi:hypothetical protein
MPKTKKLQIEEELEKEFNKKFISQEKFAEEIETYFQDNGYSNYFTAMADYCEENNIDIESVPKLISKQFKKKIEHQASKLHLVKFKPLPELPF